MRLAEILASKHPELKKKLVSAKINKSPSTYMSEVIKKTLTTFSMIFVLILLFFNQHEHFIFILIFGSLSAGYIFYFMNFKSVDNKILKRGKDIDKEVLFAGRFLLIKLNSGQPLISAIFDASKSFGVANKYFKEIVRDIELGTSLEQALTNAARYSASKRFEKILFHISNALKIGIDVTNTLNSVLDEIAEEQLIEIKRYGKKLNSLTMFYMLMAIILPSLGMTMAVVILSMLPEMGDIATPLFIGFGSLLIIIQFVFINLFKSSRPNVNI